VVLKILGRLFLMAFFCLPGLSLAMDSKDYVADLHKKITRYSHYSVYNFSRYFKHAQVEFPPKKLAILVFKQNRRMDVYAQGKNTSWQFIRSYPIYGASGGPGPKLKSGDNQVPEGIYRVVGLNPDSRYDLSMELNYPNDLDRQFAVMDHRMHLGSNIFIHGKHKSIGCVAIGDHAIEQLFPLVYFVGTDNVTVIIAPDDLRVYAPVTGEVHPKWLPKLYGRIKEALKDFPLHA
jgi:murein L,D-transpeptidase YafK